MNVCWRSELRIHVVVETNMSFVELKLLAFFSNDNVKSSKAFILRMTSC